MANRKSTIGLSEEDDYLLSDPSEIADQEARNGLLQFDEVERLADKYSAARHFEATPELFRSLNHVAIVGIRRSAGFFRLVPISITNTAHQPPAYEDVPRLVEEMCTYVNEHWNLTEDDVDSAIHVAAYLMWRLNWVHPFRDGNGRTSRAISYLALCTRVGQVLPGNPTIADQIVDNKGPYYDALDEADLAWSEGLVDVSAMEKLISRLLETQLSSI